MATGLKERINAAHTIQQKSHYLLRATSEAGDAAPTYPKATDVAINAMHRLRLCMTATKETSVGNYLAILTTRGSR